MGENDSGWGYDGDGIDTVIFDGGLVLADFVGGIQIWLVFGSELGVVPAWQANVISTWEGSGGTSSGVSIF